MPARLVFLLTLVVTLFAMRPLAAELESVLVTGSRLSDAVSGADTIVDRLEIEQINPPSTTALLRMIPNIIVSENGGAPGQAFLSIRGGEPNFTLILIDGVAVNDPTNSRGGGFDFNQLDPAMIERVEVYRGGLSAIYGGEAISGVIQFITRSDAPSSLSVAFGNEHQRQLNVNLPVKINQSLSGLLVAGNTNLERSAESAYENSQVMGKLIHSSAQATSSLLLSSSWQDLKSFPEDSGGELSTLGLTEKNDSRQDIAVLRTELLTAKEIVWNGSLSYTRYHNDTSSPGIAAGELEGIPSSEIESDFKQYIMEAYATMPLPGEAKALLGGSFRSSKGSNEGFLDFGVAIPAGFSQSQDIWSMFVETTVPWYRFKFDLGLRYDSPNSFDAETSARLAGSYSVNNNTEVYASYSEGYKLPSFFALSHPLVGNPDLKPERSTTSSVGLELQLNDSDRINLAYFYNEFKDLVDFDPEAFVSINRNSVVSKGVELNTYFQFNRYLGAALDATYLSTNIQGSNENLRRRPEWSGGGHIQATLDQTEVRLSIRSRGSSYDSSILTGPVKLSGYTSLDLAINHRIRTDLTLTFSGENLLNEDVEEAVGFQDTGALWRVGFRYQI